jgi:hypothetical protein
MRLGRRLWMMMTFDVAFLRCGLEFYWWEVQSSLLLQVISTFHVLHSIWTAFLALYSKGGLDM